MRRRDVLTGAGALGAAGLAAACAPGGAGAECPDGQSAAAGRTTRTLTMVTTWPKNFPGLGAAPERIAKRVEQATGGALKLRVYAAGELVPALEAFDAVQSGGADLYHGAEYYWQGKSQAFNFYTAVPFGMTAVEHMGWIDFAGGQALWDDLAAEFGVKPLQAGNTGHQMAGWFKKPVASLDDFKGLKMRMPGLGGQVFSAIGAAAVTLAGGEIYQALQSGAIEATEWVGPWNDLAFGFHQEAKYYYGPGVHEPGASLAVGVNLKVWESLSAEHQAVLKAACAEANHLMVGEFAYENAKALEELVTKHGVQVASFSDDIYKALKEAAADVVSSAAATDEHARKAYASWEAAMKRMGGWAAISEAPYYRVRDL